jgi:hypothetical protein
MLNRRNILAGSISLPLATKLVDEWASRTAVEIKPAPLTPPEVADILTFLATSWRNHEENNHARD